MPKAERPLPKAKDEVRLFFDAIMLAHWHAGEHAFSNEKVAELCGVDERLVRFWRDGEKPLPVAALLHMPPTLVDQVVSWVKDKRALTAHRRGVPMLEEALARLEKPIADSDRREVLRALVEAQRRISDRIAKLAGEGR